MDKRDTAERHKVQHDLYFTDACRVESFPFIGTPSIKHEFLHPAWKAFQNSTESVRIMAGLPQAVVTAAVAHLFPLVQATFNVLGKPIMEDSELEPNRQAIGEEYGRIARTLFDNRQEVFTTFTKDLVMYSKFNLVNSELTRSGFFSILEAQINGVWTAFNTLTTDLCVAVVNQKPELLKRFEGMQITVGELLACGDRNWNDRMGDLLRMTVRLDSFDGTREAYKRLFNNAQINKVISSPELTLACLVRTQLTHDGGIVTENFIRQAKKKQFDPWETFTPGTLLPLDGRLTAALSEGVVNRANELILAVDGWLNLPGESSPKPPGPAE